MLNLNAHNSIGLPDQMEEENRIETAEEWLAMAERGNSPHPFKLAQNLLESGLQQRKDQPKIWFLLGKVHMGQKQYQDAIEPFRKSCRNDASTEIEALIQLSQCFIELDKYREAEEVVGRLADEKDRSPRVRQFVQYFSAQIQLKKGSETSGQQTLDSLLQNITDHIEEAQSEFSKTSNKYDL